MMHSQTAKNILQKYQKKLNQKHNDKEVSLVKDKKKTNKIFVTMEIKVLSLKQIQCCHYKGPCPLFWFTKNTCLDLHVMTGKPTMMHKGIITFNATYLTKVTNINSNLY